MGYIRHRLLITQLPILEPRRSEVLKCLEEWRDGLPEKWRRLIVGPVVSVANGNEWVVFLPDGSKEGWGDSRLGYSYAEEFAEIFGYPLLVETTWGDDAPDVRIGLSGGDDD